MDLLLFGFLEKTCGKEGHTLTKMNEGKSIIAVKGLAKRFGEVQAIADVSFQVHEGELFGFLGPNGAGKTTTINMLTGLARPDTGKIRIADIECTGNPKAAQHFTGVVPDESNLYPELTGFDNLCFCAALYGMRKQERETAARDLLETFGLSDAGRRKFGGFSKGMKRRLTIAAGIIHDPPILFLDEPTTGIDVASARQIRQILAGLNKRGTTIFLTTHYIEEAERLCHRIAFIVDGQIVRIDTVANLVQPIQEKHVMQLAVSDLKPPLQDNLAAAFPHLAFQDFSQGLIRVEADEPIGVGPLVRFFEDQGIEVSEARKVRPSLEDVFVQITGIDVDAMKKEKEKKEGGG
jgi:ABC-2 type transport system ATP-binding protein